MIATGQKISSQPIRQPQLPLGFAAACAAARVTAGAGVAAAAAGAAGADVLCWAPQPVQALVASSTAASQYSQERMKSLHHESHHSRSGFRDRHHRSNPENVKNELLNRRTEFMYSSLGQTCSLLRHRRHNESL
jgi:hypothetical protein